MEGGQGGTQEDKGKRCRNAEGGENKDHAEKEEHEAKEENQSHKKAKTEAEEFNEIY